MIIVSGVEIDTVDDIILIAFVGDDGIVIEKRVLRMSHVLLFFLSVTFYFVVTLAVH